MGTPRPENIRAAAIVGHGGAGKTSLAEAILFNTGAISRMGRVEDKNTVSDFEPEEQKRQISINTSLCTTKHGERTLHLLDTPGFADFVGEQRSSMRVTDSSVFVINASGGVEVQTLKLWEFAEDFKTGGIFFINRLDKENASFADVVSDIQSTLTKNALPLYLPIGAEANFKGLVNVLTGKAYTYKGEGSKDFTEGDTPADMADAVASARAELIERIIEADDAVMEKYLETETVDDNEIEPLLRKAIAARICFPIIPGAATLNIGVRQLIDTIADYSPSPLDVKPRTVIVDGKEDEAHPDVNAPFTALCFKIMVDPYVGRLSFIRVFSGKLTSDQMIFNVNKGEEERISSFRVQRGKDGSDAKEIVVGDIVAIPKLDSTEVGDTMSVKGQSAVFPPIKFPRPVYSLAVSPKSRADEDKLGNAIKKILQEDKTLDFIKHPETNDSILSGMGDMHLDIALSRIKERYKVDLETATPKVSYRETIKKTASAQGKHKKQSGGRGQYGDVHFRLSPNERGAGVTFTDEVVGGAVPKNFIPAAEKGLRESAAKGSIAGYPAVDFNCAIFDGSYHDVDSSEMAFKIAASLAFKKAFVAASPILIEPIMNLDVTVPGDYLGDVMGDLSSRRGRVMGQESEGKMMIVKAQAPQSELFRYAITLRSMTGGRGSFTMDFDHYEEVPPDIAKKIIDQYQKEKVDDE